MLKYFLIFSKTGDFTRWIFHHILHNLIVNLLKLNKTIFSKIKICTIMQKKLFLVDFTDYETQTFLTPIKQQTLVKNMF